MIWTVKIKRAQRIRLICVFFSTAALTIASLYHAITLLRVGGLPEALAAVIEVSVCHHSYRRAPLIKKFRRPLVCMWPTRLSSLLCSSDSKAKRLIKARLFRIPCTSPAGPPMAPTHRLTSWLPTRPSEISTPFRFPKETTGHQVHTMMQKSRTRYTVSVLTTRTTESYLRTTNLCRFCMHCTRFHL